MSIQIAQRSPISRRTASRVVLLAGLVGLGLAAAPQAQAQGFMFHGGGFGGGFGGGGFGGGFGGMHRNNFGGPRPQNFNAAFHPNGGGFGGMGGHNRPGHFGGMGGHHPGGMAGHPGGMGGHPGGMGGHPGGMGGHPNHPGHPGGMAGNHPGGMGGHRPGGMGGHPGGLGPIFGHFPHPGPVVVIRPWRPIVIHRPTLPPPVIVERVPVAPVVVATTPVGVTQTVATGPAPTAMRAVAQSPAPAPTCANNGTFVSIVFTPNVTASDITNFLKTYSVTIADGPNNDGVYRLRLSDGTLPQNDVVQVVDSMRGQTAIVAQIEAQ